MIKITEKLKSKIKKIKALVMDVDGVLTNGKINLDHNGKEIKVFDVKDGLAIAFFQKTGYKTAILSARSAPAVAARAKDLKISKVYQNAYPKLDAFKKLLKDLNLREEQVCFIGDDWPDLCVLKRVGFSATVHDGADELKRLADYTTKKNGGEGAVREIIELIMKTQGTWKMAFKKYCSIVLIAIMFILASSARLISAADPEQKFQGFDLQGYSDEGDKSWDIQGDTADIIGDSIELKNVNANSYGEQKMNVTAETGVINQVSGDMQLREDVVVTSEAGSQLITDSLDWNKEKDLVTTEDDVFITDDKFTITGTGMESQPGLKNAVIHEDVTVRVETEKDITKASKKLTITSDGPMEIDQLKSVATFKQNVVAIQNDQILKADLMEVYFLADMSGIREMICIGNVEITQGDNKTYAEKAVYNAEKQKLKLSGRPKLILLTEGDNSIATFGN